MHPTYIHPPNCWHDISNTNIYTQLTYIPQIVGSIYSIQIYISTNLYSPTLRPKGAQKLQQYMQRDISNTHIYIQLTFIPQIVGCIYPITNLYFLNVKGILEGPVWSRNKAVQYICAYMPFLSFHHFEQFYVVNTTLSLFQCLIMV